MLEWRLWGIRCRVSLLFPALVTTLLLWQPDGLAVSCLLAALVHEGGHLLAMLALGISPQQCTLGAFGMRIDLGAPLTEYKKNLLISLSGPMTNGVAAVGLLLLNAPSTATVHAVLGIFNLLPAAALDGGEILRCGLCLLGWESWVQGILRLTSALVLLPLATMSLWLCLHSKNPTLLIVSVYLVLLLFFSDKCEKNS